MLDEGGGNGVCNRIVKFDTETGKAVAQYAYQMEGSSQGRGISALVALNDHEFLVLERNNRGIGVGADARRPNKKVFRIDLDGAADVSERHLLRRRRLSGGQGHQDRSRSSTWPPTRWPRSATRCRRSGKAWPSARGSTTAAT